jgi:alpha-tubulin suppressor-like RCC1 family protein
MLFEKLLPAVVKTTPITTGVPYVWGDNGDLGMGILFNNSYFGGSYPASTTPLGIWGIATGSYNGGTAALTAFVIKQDGSMWAWGRNDYGQLGSSGTGQLTSFQKANWLTGTWALVTQGDNGNTLATKTDGTLWAWGLNANGVLGLGNTISYSSPVQVGALTNWPTSDYRKLCCGNNSTAIVKSDGTLWTFGYNTYGTLGQNNTNNYSSPVQVGSGTNWKYVSSVNGGFIAVKTDGTLWAWGYNSQGQLALNNTTNYSSPVQVGALNTWASVAPGYAGGFAIKTDGTLWGWGSNEKGLLGIGNTVAKSSPVQVGSDTNWSAAFVGNNDTYSKTQILVKTNGTAYLTGHTYYYIDVNGGTYRSSPVQIGSLNNVAGALYANTYQTAGKSYEYVFGAMLTKTNSGANIAAIPTGNQNYACYNYVAAPIPILFDTTTKWKTISVSLYNGSSVKSDGTLWTWGYGGYGQNGLNNQLDQNSPVQVGALTNWKNVISQIQNCTIAVRTDGTLWAWGRNAYGQLGLGNVVARSSPTQVGALTTWSKIAGISTTTLAVKTDGTLWAWGDNSNGVLGLNDVNPRSSPVQVGALTNWSSISCSTASFGIKTDGTLWAWGLNVYGTLGTGNTVAYSSPVQVGALSNWASVVTCQDSTYAVKTDGTLWAWGINSAGQLGLGNNTNKSSPVQVGTLNTWASVGGTNASIYAIKTDGTMWGSGSISGNGRIGAINSPVQLSSGETLGTTTYLNPTSNASQESGVLKA